MTGINLKRSLSLLYPARVLVFGLLLAHIISTLMVWFSNHRLLAQLEALQSAGYGPLPGLHLSPPLGSLSAAMAGGLFFTLSIGAGLVLLTMGATLLIEAAGHFRLKTGLIAVLAAIWLAALVWGNHQGFNYGLTAFFILLPPPVAWVARRWSPRKKGQPPLPWRKTFHCFLIAALAAWWLLRINPEVFINIKDNLLLTSRPGIKIVHGYYRYTLYAAEVIKPLATKQVKTGRLADFEDVSQKSPMARQLAQFGYFVLPARSAPIDLTVQQAPTALLFRHHDQTMIKTDPARWQQEPATILRRFSAATDDKGPLRQTTRYLLLGVAPLVLYLLTFTGFAIFPGMLLNLRFSSLLVPVLNCLFWAFVITCLDTPPVQALNDARAIKALHSPQRLEKLAALRYFYRNNRNIRSQFNPPDNLINPTDFAQNYWLLKNLGQSRHPEDRRLLLRALHADSDYLVCLAMAALYHHHQRFPQADLPALFREKLAASPNWYVQLYAYKYLRKLGWQPATFD